MAESLLAWASRPVSCLELRARSSLLVSAYQTTEVEIGHPGRVPGPANCPLNLPRAGLGTQHQQCASGSKSNTSVAASAVRSACLSRVTDAPAAASALSLRPPSSPSGAASTVGTAARLVNKAKAVEEAAVPAAEEGALRRPRLGN